MMRSKDSGITKLADLKGKKFCPGGTGTLQRAHLKNIW